MNVHPDFIKLVVSKLPAAVYDLLVKHGPKVAVAGGFVRDAVIGSDPKDVDLFAVDERTLKAAAEEFGWDIRYFGPEVHKNSVTFKPNPESDAEPYNVQFVTRTYYPTHDELVKSFDFSICQAAVWYDGSKWRGICTPEFWEDATQDKMRYTAPTRDEDPGASVLRMIRFVNRGFTISEPEVAKCLARFYSSLSNEPEEESRVKISTAFRSVGYGGRANSQV